MVVFWIAAQSRLERGTRRGVVSHFVAGNSQQRRRGKHFGINLQALLQNVGSLLVFPLPEVERTKIVVGGRQAWSNPEERFIVRHRGGEIASGFGGFCCSVEFLYTLVIRGGVLLRAE